MSNQQVSLYNYYRRPISQKDIPIFKILVIRMCISNSLPFSFVEIEKTQAVFDFVVSNYKLPTQKRI
ncbi:6568_t:CDS:1, partial [Gigaspora margarita]